MSCITVERKENLMNLGDRLIEAMQCYGSIIDYEEQAGTIAEPTTASRGNGHLVVVYYTTYARTIIWVRVNDDKDWMGVEYT